MSIKISLLIVYKNVYKTNNTKSKEHLAIFFIKEYKPERTFLKYFSFKIMCPHIFNNDYSYACKNSSAENNFWYKKIFIKEQLQSYDASFQSKLH